jgi:uncharacterized protein
MKLVWLVFLISIGILAGFGYMNFIESSRDEMNSPVVKEKPLEKYTFENLKNTSFLPGLISLDRDIAKEDDFVSQIFYYRADGKRVSGLLNTPTAPGEYPVIVMLRGFVSKESYSTGIGTQRAGEVFAQNGFITLAPDFLGYGESDNPSENSVEERFQTYTTALSLLSSLSNLNEGLAASYSARIKADVSKIGIWAHSNGGQIGLSTLSITRKSYPTVLWAPVSKPFPYSVLYFTDEFDDHGKALRRVIADFEKDYDIDLYSPGNFYDWINAPIQLHQGGIDDAVPQEWSDEFFAELEEMDKDIEYFVYPGADHNLMPDWNTAVQRSLDFYNSQFNE